MRTLANEDLGTLAEYDPLTVNIVMWETRHSIADWVCFKTQTLQEILRTQSQPHEVSCVFLEAEHLFQSVGCARNKLRFLHRSTKYEVISLDVGLRMSVLPALDLWGNWQQFNPTGILRTTKP